MPTKTRRPSTAMTPTTMRKRRRRRTRTTTKRRTMRTTNSTTRRRTTNSTSWTMSMMAPTTMRMIVLVGRSMNELKAESAARSAYGFQLQA